MVLNSLICGIDEAGRGPLAGPVCAAAVILPKDFDISVLNDSKKMSETQKNSARSLICSTAIAWGIGWADHAEIDEINILQASLRAMKRAFENMLKSETLKKYFNEAGQLFSPEELYIEVIVDGLHVPPLDLEKYPHIKCSALVKADAKVPEVMAASILAKTARDEKMEQYALQYPEYGYEQHKGYPTKAHRIAILKYGPSPIQRVTFTVKRD